MNVIIITMLLHCLSYKVNFNTTSKIVDIRPLSIHSLPSLSCDRSIASSKVSSPESAN